MKTFFWGLEHSVCARLSLTLPHVVSRPAGTAAAPNALLKCCLFRGDFRRITQTGQALPVQPKGPRRVQRQRLGGCVVSVFLCDIFQLLLVDVNVVFGGNRLSAQGVSVHLEVRLSRRKRHFGRPGSDFCSSGADVLNKYSRFCFICSYRNTAAFPPPDW